MNQKIPFFFIAFVSVFFGCTSSFTMNNKLISLAASPSAGKVFIPAQNHLSNTKFFHMQVDNKIQNSGIVPFSMEFEPKIEKIALDNIHRLASPIDTPDKLYKNQILAAMKDEGVKTRVYLDKGEPVGFVNYDIWEPLPRKYIMPGQLGKKGKIIHIAIDKEHQGKGYGTLLMKYVIGDFKKNSVNGASLWTTFDHKDLEKFYARFGFIPKFYSKMHTVRYGAKLGPNTFITFLKKIRDNQ